jgi:monofunctional biosynthetic peptidoglycan transglycosylase
MQKSQKEGVKFLDPNWIFRILVLAVMAIPTFGLISSFQRPLTWISFLVGFGSILLLVPLVLVLILRWVRPPTSALMIQKKLGWGGMIREPNIAYTWVDYEQIAPAMCLATIAVEDNQFALHFGFDFESMREAYLYNKENEIKRGASTITQQVAKNLFLWPEQSYLRKAVEAYFTVLIEAIWSKRRILEVYLNIARFDIDIFGVGAASQSLLGKAASEISTEEACLMAAVLASPVRYHIVEPTHTIRYRQIMISARMKQLGYEYLKYL